MISLQDIVSEMRRKHERKMKKLAGSKYRPHNGEQEKARRIRQKEKGMI
jgi:hypothetical protein